MLTIIGGEEDQMYDSSQLDSCDDDFSDDELEVEDTFDITVIVPGKDSY